MQSAHTGIVSFKHSNKMTAMTVRVQRKAEVFLQEVVL